MTPWYIKYKNSDVLVRMLISRLSRGSTLILGALKLNSAFWPPPQKKKGTSLSKIHHPVYCMKLSDERCRQHPSSRTTPPKTKCHLRLYVGCLPESGPLCKCYQTWHGGSCRVRCCSDHFWSTPLSVCRDTKVEFLSLARPIGLTTHDQCKNVFELLR